MIPDVGKKIVLSVDENYGRVGTGCAVKLGACSLGAFVRGRWRRVGTRVLTGACGDECGRKALWRSESGKSRPSWRRGRTQMSTNTPGPANLGLTMLGSCVVWSAEAGRGGGRGRASGRRRNFDTIGWNYIRGVRLGP